MPLSPDEAANTLRDIAQTERHSSAVYGYRTASPYLILWGVIWMLGYGAVSVRPADSVIWIPLIILGCLANFWIGARSKPRNYPEAPNRNVARMRLRQRQFSHLSRSIEARISQAPLSAAQSLLALTLPLALFQKELR